MCVCINLFKNNFTGALREHLQQDGWEKLLWKESDLELDI